MKKVNFILVLIIVFVAVAKAQNFQQTIRGKVIDKETHQPLPGASVILINSNPVIGIITDNEGEFEFKNVPIGRQGITVSFIGYNTTEMRNLLLQTGKETVVEVELSEKVENLNEVEVKANTQKDRALNEMALISSRSFTIEQTERFAGSVGDPARMVGNYAGVAMQSDSRNDIVIRGNSPMGLIWRLDDVEIPNPNHFGALGTTGGPVSMLNNNLLTNSDFYTGAFPAEFGNGISGAFDLHMRPGNNQKTEFTGQIGFNGFELGAEGPFSKKSKASYLISGRYSTMAVMHLMGFGTGTGSAIPYYQDLTFKVELPTKKLGKFSLIGLLGSSKIDLGADLKDSSNNAYNLHGQRTKFGTSQKVVGLSNLYFFNEKTRLKTIVSAQETKNNTLVDIYKKETDTICPFYRSAYTLQKYSFAMHLKSKLNNKNNIGIGYVVDFSAINLGDSLYMEDYRKFIIRQDVAGNYMVYRAYSQYQHKFSDNLTAYAGIDFLKTSLSNDYSIEPRAGMEWKFSPLQSFTLGYGKHSQIQPPMIYFLQYNDSVNNTYKLTNKNTGLTKADHIVLGYNYLLSANLRLKIETYYQNLYHIPVSPSFKEFSMLNAGDNFGLPMVDSLQNTGTGKNYGVELTLEKFLDHGYYFLFTSSVFDSKYKGYDNIMRNTAFNNNYVLNLLGGYEFKAGKKSLMTFDVKACYAGGKRYVPINLEASKAGYETEYDWQDSYRFKYDDYFRIDLRIGFKINGKKYSQEYAIDIQNITANKSTFMEAYDFNAKEIYSTYQQGFYPMFLYRVQF